MHKYNSTCNYVKEKCVFPLKKNYQHIRPCVGTQHMWPKTQTNVRSRAHVAGSHAVPANIVIAPSRTFAAGNIHILLTSPSHVNWCSCIWRACIRFAHMCGACKRPCNTAIIASLATWHNPPVWCRWMIARLVPWPRPFLRAFQFHGCIPRHRGKGHAIRCSRDMWMHVIRQRPMHFLNTIHIYLYVAEARMRYFAY